MTVEEILKMQDADLSEMKTQDMVELTVKLMAEIHDRVEPLLIPMCDRDQRDEDMQELADTIIDLSDQLGEAYDSIDLE